MDWLLVTRQGVDAAYEIPDNVSRLRVAVEGSNPPKDRCFVPIKLSDDPPLLTGASFSSRSVHVSSSASLSQSTHSPVWISDLISMASTCSQPIAHSYPPLIHRQTKLSVLETSILRCVAVRLCCSL
jgi:hypothetical protein